MNFISKYYKLSAIFLGFLISTSLLNLNVQAVSTPGNPFVTNYNLPEPFSYYMINSMVKDSNGTVFISFNDNLLCVYNNDYDFLNLPGKVLLTSLSSTIYVSSDHFIGYIDYNGLGEPYIQSILSDSLAKASGINAIDQISYFNSDIYFTSGNKLYRFNAQNLEVLAENSDGFKFFQTKNQLFILFNNNQLYRIVNEGTAKIKGSFKDKNEQILWIYESYNINYLITNKSNKYILQSNNDLFYIGKCPENFTVENNFVSLNDSLLILSDSKKGILFYDQEFHELQTIGIEQGLPENRIKYLTSDPFGNLLALFDNTLTIVHTGYPIYYLGLKNGIKGKVKDISSHKNNLYLATSTGVFYSNDINKKYPHFTPIESVTGNGISLFENLGQLLAVTSNGVFELSDNESVQVIEQNVISTSTFNKSGTKYLITGNNDHLTLYDLKKPEYEILKSIPYHEPINSIIPDKNGYLWLLSGLNRINILPIDKIQTDGKIKNLAFLKPAVNSIVVNNNLLYFISKQDIYIFNYNQGIFEKDSIITSLEKGKTLKLFPINTNDSLRQWYTYSDPANNNYGLLIRSYNNAEYPVLFLNIPYHLSGKVYVDRSSAWIGSYNGLLHFNIDLAGYHINNLKTRISEIKIGNDSIVDPKTIGSFNYKYNDIRFAFSTTQVENDLVQFQYKLESFNNQWSDWSGENIKDYTNLNPGKYKFLVRSRNLNGKISGISSYTFVITRPYYLSLPFYFLYTFIGLIIIFIFFRWRTWIYLKENERLENIIHERTLELLMEKEKTEQLLANVLPKGTAEELKSTGKAVSQKYAMATVLFSDIQGFTKIAEHLNPDTLIDQLDSFFFQFDSVVEKYNIEKIKTIGDAYMCAGGIPNKNITNPVEVVLAALEMQDYMYNLKQKNNDIWDLRIGIHTGPIIAGVVGQKKLSYDIWGDTVNVASRMESSGEIGKINISGYTYDHVKDFFICEYRGKMPVKYKGEIDMYFVKGIRPELSLNMKNIPNHRFHVKLQLLRLSDLQEFIFAKYQSELPKNLHFHNLQYIKDTFNTCELLGNTCELSEEERLILLTAILTHSIGYIWSYENHEIHSVKFLKELLPTYSYNNEQIDKICQLVEVTHRGQKAQNNLEEILLDSLMSYLGRPDFVVLSDNLFNELREYNQIQSKEEWVKMQVTLLSNHRFNTEAANNLREIPAQKQIEYLVKSFEKNS